MAKPISKGWFEFGLFVVGDRRLISFGGKWGMPALMCLDLCISGKKITLLIIGGTYEPEQNLIEWTHVRSNYWTSRQWSHILGCSIVWGSYEEWRPLLWYPTEGLQSRWVTCHTQRPSFPSHLCLSSHLYMGLNLLRDDVVSLLTLICAPT